MTKRVESPGLQALNAALALGGRLAAIPTGASVRTRGRWKALGEDVPTISRPTRVSHGDYRGVGALDLALVVEVVELPETWKGDPLELLEDGR